MKTWIVSYADAAFATSLHRLMESAARFCVDRRRPWQRDTLEQTTFYKFHKAILDFPRGGGYWLWKPFIIKETLREMGTGDLLIYSDAGIDIVADLQPLWQMCQQREILLFANHYDNAGGPGANVCAKWTKRDCFVFMDCDEAQYHDARMLDASFIVMANTPRTMALMREWLLYCCQGQILTDDPNVCGLPNLEGFVAHRHDQSVLSILSARERFELFRHPSQHGNHLKEERFRVPGEWTRAPYAADGSYANSPYPTLLHHDRGRRRRADLSVVLSRDVPAPRERVFQAWTEQRVLQRWTPLGRPVVAAHADVRVDGPYRLTIGGGPGGASSEVRGIYLEVDPPARLVYTWPWDSQVTVEFRDKGGRTAVTLRHEPFPSEKLREYHARAWTDFLDTVADAALIPD